MFRNYWILPAIFAVIFSFGCEQKKDPTLEPLPEIHWDSPAVTPFLTQDAWKTASQDWIIINDALRFSFDLPEALETRLTKEDREVWKNALENIERSQLERNDASLISKVQIS